MRSLVPFICCILAGCFYVGKETSQDITQRPPDDWSSRDGLTILLQAMRHNGYELNSSNVGVIAIPYTPSVIMALNRMSGSRLHWSKDEYHHETDVALQEISGLYLDWHTNRLVDGRGNFVHGADQLDSLLFFVSLINKGYPLYIPDITDLETRIYLSNDSGMKIRPKYVWGRRRNQLTNLAEDLLVMFPLHAGALHLLKKTNSVYLEIEKFDGIIRVGFPVDEILPHPPSEAIW